MNSDLQAQETEYDFSEAVQGKHDQAYQQGYQVTIYKMDGTTEVREFALPDGGVRPGCARIFSRFGDGQSHFAGFDPAHSGAIYCVGVTPSNTRWLERLG